MVANGAQCKHSMFFIFSELVVICYNCIVTFFAQLTFSTKGYVMLCYAMLCYVMLYVMPNRVEIKKALNKNSDFQHKLVKF